LTGIFLTCTFAENILIKFSYIINKKCMYMKKLVLFCISLALFAGKSAAQNAGSALSAAELKERMAVNAPYLHQKYKSASNLRGVGMGMTLGGVAATIIGIAVADKETINDGMSTQVNLSGPGAGIFAVGLVSAVAGTPLWIIGGVKRKNARNAYLREFGYSINAPVDPSPYLQLNVTPNRMGLALVF